MEENGKLLNPKYANHTEDDYQTGLIVEYDTDIKLEKADQPGATLADNEKVVYEDGDVLSAADAQTLAQEYPGLSQSVAQVLHAADEQVREMQK